MGRGTAHNGRSISARFLPFPPPFPAPPPSQFQPQLVPSAHPQVAPALPGWGRRPPGIRDSLTCTSRLSLVFSWGQALSPSPGAAGRWQLRLEAPARFGSVRVSSPPWTPHGALNSGRGFLNVRTVPSPKHRIGGS